MQRTLPSSGPSGHLPPLGGRLYNKGDTYASLFSIIIPVYNVQNYLSACVKSVVEQPGPRDWECILVDDGSTDQSGAMCDVLAAELPGLQVIHRENGGLAAARNIGLKGRHR